MRRWSQGVWKRYAVAGELVQIALLCVLSALVLVPLLHRSGWIIGHERNRYPILLDHFREVFLQGQLYPRWLPRLDGGYGYPTFVFYQPGFFFFSLPFALLPIDSLSVLKLVVWALFSIGASGVYYLCREVSDRKLALACAVLFLLTPFLFVDLYVRNDLSELMAMVLGPWPLFFALRLDRQVRQGCGAASLVGLAASLTLLLLSHPAVALFAVPLWGAIAVYASSHGSASERKAVWLRLAIGFAVAVLASSPYWLTVFRMQEHANMEDLGKGYYLPSAHLVQWPDYFSNAWGFGDALPRGGHDAMPIPLGLLHALLAIVGAFLGWRLRVVRAAFVAYLSLVVLMSTLGERFWNLPVESIRRVQFPWRLLALTATLQPLCMAGLGSVRRQVYGARMTVVAPALLLLAVLWYRQQFLPQEGSVPLQAEIARRRARDLASWQRFAALDEFRPKSVLERPPSPRGTTPLLEVGREASATPASTSTESHLRYQIDSDEPVEVTLHQSYLPGWRVRIDGRDVPREVLEVRLTKEGWMRVSLPAGSHNFDALYDGPPGWRWQAIVCLLGLGAFGAFCLREWRRRPKGGALVGTDAQ